MRIVLVCVILLFSMPVFAQSVQEQINRQQEQIQREQQSLIDEEIRQRELEDALRAPVEPNIEVEIPDALISGHCVYVSEIIFDGNTKISDKAIRQKNSEYKGRCLDINDINQLLLDITNLYLDKGYITSRAFMTMPQDKLSSRGILEIKIVEGKLSSLQGIKRSELFFAFPSVEGKVLNMRPVEQGLDQINRLPSNNATLDIQANEDKEGYSDIIISNKKGDTSRVSVFLDNAGSDYTGEWRTGLRFAQDNLLSLNDQINMSYTKGINSDYDLKDSNAFTFGLSIPFGYWNFNNNFSFSNNKSNFKLPISGDYLISTGETYTDTMSISRLLSRGQKYKLSAGAGLTHRDTKSYTKVMDTKLKNDAASRRITTLNVELPMTFYFQNGTAYIKPSYHRGLRLFGALDDRETDYSQKAQFDLYKLYSYYSRRVGPGTFSTSIEAQYSPDELFGSEMMYIGGEYSVRGFKKEGSQGDYGGVIRNDYSINMQVLADYFEEKTNFDLRPYTITFFIDYGIVDSNNKENYETYNLCGFGGTFDMNFKYFNLSATYASVLDKPGEITESNALYFTATFNYTF